MFMQAISPAGRERVIGVRFLSGVARCDEGGLVQGARQSGADGQAIRHGALAFHLQPAGGGVAAGEGRITLGAFDPAFGQAEWIPAQSNSASQKEEP